MEKKRSVGVIVCSTIVLVFGLLLIAYGYEKALNFGPKIYIDTFNFIIFASGIVSVATSIGLYMLQEWVRRLCVVFSALNCLIFISFMFYWVIGGVLTLNYGGEWGFFYATVLSPFVILRLYLLIFLTRPKVKEQFQIMRT